MKVFKNNQEINEWITDRGYEDYFENIMLLEDVDYASAFIGITSQGQAVYSFRRMIDYLVDNMGMDIDKAVDWISYNTIPTLYFDNAPVILYEVEDEKQNN